jgi:hypothetical protein
MAFLNSKLYVYQRVSGWIITKLCLGMGMMIPIVKPWMLVCDVVLRQNDMAHTADNWKQTETSGESQDP